MSLTDQEAKRSTTGACSTFWCMSELSSLTDQYTTMPHRIRESQKIIENPDLEETHKDQALHRTGPKSHTTCLRVQMLLVSICSTICTNFISMYHMKMEVLKQINPNFAVPKILKRFH